MVPLAASYSQSDAGVHCTSVCCAREQKARGASRCNLYDHSSATLKWRPSLSLIVWTCLLVQIFFIKMVED